MDAGDPRKASSAGERGAIHDPRLARVLLGLLAFADGRIEACVILRSDAADEQTARNYQKQCGRQEQRTKNQLVERHSKRSAHHIQEAL